MEDRARRSPWVVFGRLTAIAWEFLGGIGGGAFVGYFADRAAGTEPWLLIVFTLLGTGAGFYRMIQLLGRFQREG